VIPTFRGILGSWDFWDAGRELERPLTRERNHVVLAAVVAVHPQQPVREDPALQERSALTVILVTGDGAMPPVQQLEEGVSVDALRSAIDHSEAPERRAAAMTRWQGVLLHSGLPANLAKKARTESCPGSLPQV
jgi:hypothetical protein